MIKADVFLDENDLKKLLTAKVSLRSNPIIFNTILQLLWDSGARISEITSLKIEHFDSGKRLITLKRTKNKEDRRVPVTDEVNALLIKIIGKRKEGYIFQGMTRSSFYNALQRRVVGSRIGKRVTPHSFRHNFITRKIDKGVSLAWIQHFVGHKSLEMTGQYYRFAEKHLRSVLEA